MQNYIETASVTYAAAASAVDAGITVGAAAGVRAVITVVDPSMTPVAFGKADNATPHSVETSRRKANTAASTRRATGWMQGEFGVLLPLGTNGMLTNIKGGAPLAFDGVHVGGLGVAGGTPDQDAAIAKAVLEAIGADDFPGGS
jgi:glc operon protein GlcG